MTTVLRAALFLASLTLGLGAQSLKLRLDDLDLGLQLPAGWVVAERRKEVGRDKPYLVAEAAEGSSLTIFLVNDKKRSLVDGADYFRRELIGDGAIASKIRDGKVGGLKAKVFDAEMDDEFLHCVVAEKQSALLVFCVADPEKPQLKRLLRTILRKIKIGRGEFALRLTPQEPADRMWFGVDYDGKRFVHPVSGLVVEENGEWKFGVDDINRAISERIWMFDEEVAFGVELGHSFLPADSSGFDLAETHSLEKVPGIDLRSAWRTLAWAGQQVDFFRARAAREGDAIFAGVVRSGDELIRAIVFGPETASSDLIQKRAESVLKRMRFLPVAQRDRISRRLRSGPHSLFADEATLSAAGSVIRVLDPGFSVRQPLAGQWNVVGEQRRKKSYRDCCLWIDFSHSFYGASFFVINSRVSPLEYCEKVQRNHHSRSAEEGFGAIVVDGKEGFLWTSTDSGSVLCQAAIKFKEDALLYISGQSTSPYGNEVFFKAMQDMVSQIRFHGKLEREMETATSYVSHGWSFRVDYREGTENKLVGGEPGGTMAKWSFERDSSHFDVKAVRLTKDAPVDDILFEIALDSLKRSGAKVSDSAKKSEFRGWPARHFKLKSKTKGTGEAIVFRRGRTVFTLAFYAGRGADKWDWLKNAKFEF